MPRLFALIFLVTGLTFGSMAIARDLPTARPHDFDREVTKLATGVYQLHLEPDEVADFSSEGMVRIMIDETRIIGARIDEDEKRVLLRANRPGKAVVTLAFKDGTVSTFIINVNGDQCAKK